MRLLVLARTDEGESPATVAVSFGLYRGWTYQVLAAAMGRGAGSHAQPAQERKVLGCINGRNLRQIRVRLRSMVVALIWQKFTVAVSLTSAGALLARLGSLVVQTSRFRLHY